MRSNRSEYLIFRKCFWVKAVAKTKHHPLFFLLWGLLLIIYLVVILAFTQSVLRFADDGNNIRFAVGLLLFPIPLFLMSLVFHERIQQAALILWGTVWITSAGTAFAVGIFYFATLDEVCFTKEVLRIPLNRTEIAVTWRTCMGPEYARLSVHHERRLFGGVRLRKGLYDREIEENLDGLDGWVAEILVRLSRSVLVPIGEGKDLSVEVIPPDRVIISEGEKVETLQLHEFIYF